MVTSLKLPVGIEGFREIRRLGFYYIDKTKLIEQLLGNWRKVNLFARLRRFGKTLSMMCHSIKPFKMDIIEKWFLWFGDCWERHLKQMNSYNLLF